MGKLTGHRVSKYDLDLQHFRRKRPRCEIVFDENHIDYEWRKEYYTVSRPDRCVDPWQQCFRPASYHINGKYYCTQHAGKIILDALFPPFEVVP